MECRLTRLLRHFALLLLAGPATAFAATQLMSPELPPGAPQAADRDVRRFAAVQLEQLVAPIALYPDALLSTVLMGATYPFELVQAARFVKSNPALQGDGLEQALQERDWDPSVKALCALPDVLARMDANLDWTRDLGDAFLAQQSELMDAVQRMRRRAVADATLRSTPEQVVTTRIDDTVVIEPATQVIYVPVYDPVRVYGGWGYSSWYYPGLYLAPWHGAPFFFQLGFSWAPWSPWFYGRCDWSPGRARVQVDVRVHDRFVTRTTVESRRVLLAPAGSSAPRDVAWGHDPQHRRGVNYRTPAVAREFRDDRSPRSRFTADEARGRGPADEARRRAPTPRDDSAASDRRHPPSPAAEDARDPDRARAAADRGSRSLNQPRPPRPPRDTPRSGPPAPRPPAPRPPAPPRPHGGGGND